MSFQLTAGDSASRGQRDQCGLSVLWCIPVQWIIDIYDEFELISLSRACSEVHDGLSRACSEVHDGLSRACSEVHDGL